MAAGGTQRLGGAETARTLPSLLWPSGPSARAQLSPQTAADLDLEPLVAALSGGEADRARFVAEVLTDLPTDVTVIAYRADTLTNLLDEPGLRGRLEALLPLLAKVARERRRPIFGVEWSAAQIVDRLGDLEVYVEAALELEAALQGAGARAPGLLALRNAVEELTGTPEFLALRDELPILREQLDSVQSVTIGVNVTGDLRPESATILSVDDRKIEGRNGLLGRLLGKEAAKTGITRLRGGSGASFRGFFPPMRPNSFGYENDLVRDLQRLMDRVITPLGEAIERFVWAQTRDFVALDAELHFLLQATGLVERLRRAGLPVTRPEIAPSAERACSLEDAYNPSLALRTLSGTGTAIVTNRVSFDASEGRVWILTGPNRGGKTTYARAVGLAHVLAQAGLYVPARTACMSPVDGIWTHFPTLEKGKPGEGRLDDEAIRLADIFRAATPHSLILLNEVMTGTSTIEALGLAYDAVRGLHLLGARAIYVTHLHELADRAEEINAGTCGDGTVGSLVAEVDDTGSEADGSHRRTFRIRPSPPLGVSYASEIAEQHGISYPQLVELLRTRGVIGESS
jgi:hypothetical protein